MSELDLICVLANCYNMNSFETLRNILDEDCHYASQWVFEEMIGKDRITDFLVAKSIRIAETGAKVRADIGTIKNPYAGKKCLVMRQGSDDEVKTIIMIEINSNKISRIDICMPELFTYSVDEQHF